MENFRGVGWVVFFSASFWDVMKSCVFGSGCSFVETEQMPGENNMFCVSDFNVLVSVEFWLFVSMGVNVNCLRGGILVLRNVYVCFIV